MNVSEKQIQEVLYQKMGDIWYIFTRINDELYFTPLPKNLSPFDKNFQLFEVVDKLEKVPEEMRNKNFAAV